MYAREPSTLLVAGLVVLLPLIAWAQNPPAVHLNDAKLLQGMPEARKAWNKKDGTAVEYRSGGSNYRTYKPTATPSEGGGLFVSTKIDHMRGFGDDDHAQVELTFNAEGKLENSKVHMEIQEKNFKPIDTGAIDAGAKAAGPKAVVAAEIAKKIAGSLNTSLASLNDHGGRANFPAVVQHNINAIAAAVER